MPQSSCDRPPIVSRYPSPAPSPIQGTPQTEEVGNRPPMLPRSPSRNPPASVSGCCSWLFPAPLPPFFVRPLLLLSLVCRAKRLLPLFDASFVSTGQCP